MQWGTSQEIESGRKWGKKCKLQLPARSCLAKWVNGDEAAAGSCWRKGASTTQQEKKGHQIDVGAWEKWEQNVEKKYSLLFCCRQNAMRTFDSDCKSPTEEKAEEKRGKKRRLGGQLTLIMGHVGNTERRRVGINRQERSTCCWKQEGKEKTKTKGRALISEGGIGKEGGEGKRRKENKKWVWVSVGCTQRGD